MVGNPDIRREFMLPPKPLPAEDHGEDHARHVLIRSQGFRVVRINGVKLEGKVAGQDGGMGPLNNTRIQAIGRVHRQLAAR